MTRGATIEARCTIALPVSRTEPSKRLSCDRPAWAALGRKIRLNDRRHPTLEGRMDIDKLLERVVAQNDIIIRQNEKLCFCCRQN